MNFTSRIFLIIENYQMKPINSKRYLIFILIFCVMFCDILLADQTDILIERLSLRISRIRDKIQVPSVDKIRISEEEIAAADPNRVLTWLMSVEIGENYIIGRPIYWYQWRLARQNKSTRIRQQVCENLVKTLVGPKRPFRLPAFKWLMTFDESYFSETSKNIIRGELSKDKPDRDMIFLCGIANISEELPRLETLLIDEFEYREKARHPIWYRTHGFAARLARARMGVQEDIEKCIQLIDTAHLTYKLELLHLIGYIRQPEAIRYLHTCLNSNEYMPPDHDVPRRDLSRRAMHALTLCLSDFPVEYHEHRIYSRGKIDLSRNWMDQQTEWKIIR